MAFSSSDLQAIWLTFKLATATTILLLLLSTPLAWWLAQTRSRWRSPVAAIVALPLVLPPTVLGFYLLVAFGPRGWGGQLTEALGIGLLPFTFGGLLVGSILYSLPFAVQPLQTAFEGVRASHQASGAASTSRTAVVQVASWKVSQRAWRSPARKSMRS